MMLPDLSHRFLVRRRARGEQRGLALLVTLAAMFVTMLLVTALLGLTMSTTAFSGDQLNRDEQTRAAEGALHAAMARIARDETATLGSLGDEELCNWAPDDGEDESDRPTMEVETNGQLVEVTCQAESPGVFAPEDDVADGVLVVGEYQGAASEDLALNAKNWRVTPGVGERCMPADDCFAWREALDAGDVAANNAGSPSIDGMLGQLADSDTRVGVAHTGFDPLRLIGDVQVKHGTASLRNGRACDFDDPDPCPYALGGPGLSVTGTYVQGDQGFQTSATLDPASCGILEPADPAAIRPFQVLGAQVATQRGLLCGDVPGTVAAQELDPLTAGLDMPSAWREATIAAARPGHPSNGLGNQIPFEHNSCPPTAGGVGAKYVRLYPGAYTKDLSVRLNFWLNDCPGAIYHFQPGNYWFDVDQNTTDPTLRHALRFTNPENYVVFGTANGAALTYTGIENRAQPLCDPVSANGVTITLSGRTSIVHEAGTLNICGRNVPNAPATIWQEPAPDVGVVEEVQPVTGRIDPEGLGEFDLDVSLSWQWAWPPLGVDVEIDLNMAEPGSIPTPTALPVSMSAKCWFDIGLGPVDCRADVDVFARFAPEGGTPHSRAAINSALVTLRGSSTKVDLGNSTTRFEVYLPTVPNQAACTVTFPRLPDQPGSPSPGVRAYDLLNPGPGTSGTCAGHLNSRQDLFNALVRVVMDIDPPATFPWDWNFDYGVTLDSLQMHTAWSPRPVGRTSPHVDAAFCEISGSADRNRCHAGGTAADSVGAKWKLLDASRVTANGGAAPAASFRMKKNCPWVWDCNLATAETGTIMLTNLDDRYSPNMATAPGSALATAGLIVRGQGVCQSNLNAIDIFGVLCESNVASGSGSRVVATILNSNGSTYCTQIFSKLPEGNENRYLDLMAAPGDPDSNVANGSNCYQTGRLGGATNATLLGKDLRVQFDMRRNWCGVDDFIPTNWDCRWWGYDVGRIALVTTSTAPDPVDGTPDPNATVMGPRTPMRVTSNYARGRNSTPTGDEDPNYWDKASFAMFGALSLPGNDLDVRWSGKPTPAGEWVGPDSYHNGNLLPIVSASPNSNGATTMVVRGIGSDMRAAAHVTDPPVAGVICCAEARPGERVVELRAWIGREDGEPLQHANLRAVTKVRIRDHVPVDVDDVGLLPETAFHPGNQIRIEDWRVCTRGTGPDGSACEVV